MRHGDYLSTIGGAKPLPGLRLGKIWRTRAKAFVAAAPTPGDAHLLVLQSGMMDSEAVAPVVLRHAIEHWDSLLGQEGPIRLVSGLQLPGYSFDSVIAVHPDAHNFERRENPDVHQKSFQVFPVCRFEVPASLTFREAVTLASPRFVRLTDLSRAPAPILRARFELRTHRSVGSDRALATLAMVRPAIDALPGDPSGWVELENFLGEVIRVTWGSGQYRIGLATGELRVAQPEFGAWLDAYAKEGMGAEFAHPGAASERSAAPAKYVVESGLSLRLEDGSVSDDLTDWQLEQELARLRSDGSHFAVLSRDREHYIQCHLNDDGSFDVEVRDGGRDAHFVVRPSVDRTKMIELFARYASGGDWRAGSQWKRIALPS